MPQKESPAAGKLRSPYGGTISYPPYSPNLAVLHTHEVCEIYCVFRGNGHYVTEGTQHKLEHGKLILMRPGEAHKVFLTGNEPYDRIVHNFPVSAVDAIDPERRLLTPFFDRPLGMHNAYPRSAVASTKIYDLFTRLHADMGDEYATKLNKTLVLFSILSELKSLFDAGAYMSPAEGTQQMHAVLEYINEHLADDLCVEQICRKFFLSRSQLNRGFKDATGTTVWDYVMTKRLLRAKMYMSDGMRAGAAASACGFRDYSSFYRSYIKKYGVSPSGVRE